MDTLLVPLQQDYGGCVLKINTFAGLMLKDKKSLVSCSLWLFSALGVLGVTAFPKPVHLLPFHGWRGFMSFDRRAGCAAREGCEMLLGLKSAAQ